MRGRGGSDWGSVQIVTVCKIAKEAAPRRDFVVFRAHVNTTGMLVNCSTTRRLTSRASAPSAGARSGSERACSARGARQARSRSCVRL